MNKPRLSLAFLAIGLLVFGAACQPKNENGNTNDDSNINTAVNANGNVNDDDSDDDDANVNGASNTNSSDDEDDDANANSNTNSSDDDNEVDDVDGALRLTKPEKGETIDSPFEVEGKSSATSVTINIKKADGALLFSVPATVRNGEFHANLTFAFTNTTNGIVEVVESGGATASATVTFNVETSDDDTNDTSNSNTNSSEDENDDS